MSDARQWIRPDDADGSEPLAEGDAPEGSEPLAEGCSPDAPDSDEPPSGLSWCWNIDLAAVLDAVAGVAPWLREPTSHDPQAGAEPASADCAKVEAEDAEFQEAITAGRA